MSTAMKELQAIWDISHESRFPEMTTTFMQLSGVNGVGVDADLPIADGSTIGVWTTIGLDGGDATGEGSPCSSQRRMITFVNRLDRGVPKRDREFAGDPFGTAGSR